MRKTMSIAAITERMAAGILAWCVVSTPAEVTAGVAASTNTQTYVQLERLIEAVNMGNSVAPGVTPSGVTNYVAASVGQAISNSPSQIASSMVTEVDTDGTYKTSIKAGKYNLSIRTEASSVRAVVAKDVTPLGLAYSVSNGTKWAYSSRSSNYENKNLQKIVWTGTGYTWGALASHVFDGSYFIVDSSTNKLFRAARQLIQESEAKEIRGY